MRLSDDAAIGLLEGMLRVPSLCGEEDALAGMLLQEMEGAGLTAWRDGAGNVHGQRGPSDESATRVTVLGHMDTVPGVVPVERRDGCLYGRGAVDAKGPLATAIVAASRASGTAHITVIGAVQEEGPSLGAHYLATQGAPDLLIIAEPSGWEAVVLGYKGSQRFTLRLTVPGGHTAGPEASAAERGIAFWKGLTAWCAAHSGHDNGGEFTRLTPTLIGFNTETDGLHDTVRLQVGLRLPLGISPSQIQNDVHALLPEAQFNFSPGEPAVRGDKSNRLVAAFLRSIRAEGAKPRFKVKTGTSDMNVVGPVWGCPMLAYGPGNSRLDHTPHEHIVVDDYLRAIRVLTRVLEEV